MYKMIRRDMQIFRYLLSKYAIRTGMLWSIYRCILICSQKCYVINVELVFSKDTVNGTWVVKSQRNLVA